MILIGIIIGFGVGIIIGLFLGERIMKSQYKIINDSYAKGEKYWFENYLKMLDWYQEMQTIYFKEAAKNIGKK